ncbi:GH92 family glycosyl hydrolase [Hymenobacter sp. BT186]|uniref:GH92 family glycosyl hydrolase n=1 Tax=Hymenobacter telluris TaxID=2816474 RepID=A0A939JF97_9BACT|nr:GH92 family glycosyl hydrolase [Hymenobacter telluris]MBO0360793.1 GH92 family glycosyl hydrolase [Hymenobacter telluris]MBW3376822.1 GH92 family glycosyl hydrolase [Hymenobacter norwichensis]
MSRLLLALLTLLSFSATAQAPRDLAALVNPLMGTDSKPSLSNGNTYPAIARPWGMNFWLPQTGKMGSGWAYQYSADKLKGFKQTHQPSPWMNDYGQFSVMPITGKLRFEEDDRASWFSHKAEEVTPYYYRVYLADHNITTELTPTERAARFRFTFPQTDSAYVVLDALDKGSHVQVLPKQRRIIGYTTRNSGGVPQNFKNYFILEFDHDFLSTTIYQDKVLDSKLLEATANHTGAVVGFKTRKGEQVQVRVASSFISPEQAERNLGEIGQDNFDTVKEKGRAAWNEQLGRVQVEGGTDAQQRTFYSCLYRSLLFPRKFYELDAQGQPVHYSPYNGQVLPGFLYTDTGFWDTFRCLFPFLNLVYPDVNSQMQAGLVNTYKEGGWLPEWASPGYRDVMVGNNSASVVADAYLKGLRGYDINVLYEAMLKGANAQGPLEAVGRAGASYYNKLGYVPYDVKINENAARTLEYAYDDFAIAQLGQALGRPKKEVALYYKRSQNYRNLFDRQTNLMRGRNQNGTFQTPFNPFKWGDAFTEGNSWHYTWSVFHDVHGLMTLMGGPKPFVAALDTVFTLAPVFDASYYGSVIHEIREMQIADMGNYAHGNQPIQHMVYLYAYAGQPWKTQYWAREVLNRLYLPTPDGYCGDEDNGQTSAWYVFSALGFYPVCPATDQYVLGAPLFPKTTLRLPNGKTITLNAPANSATNRYVQAVRLNGQPYTRNYLSHAALQQGATVDFEMADQPNTSRGIGADDAPYSFSRGKR